MFGWYNVQISTSDCNQKAKTYLEPAVFHTYMYIYVVYLDIMCVYIYTRVYIYTLQTVSIYISMFFLTTYTSLLHPWTLQVQLLRQLMSRQYHQVGTLHEMMVTRFICF